MTIVKGGVGLVNADAKPCVSGCGEGIIMVVGVVPVMFTRGVWNYRCRTGYRDIIIGWVG